MIKSIILGALALTLILGSIKIAFGQESEKESPFSTGSDLVSRYIWRGIDFGSSPSIQPYIEYSKGSFGIGAWGAYTTNINAPVQEMDLYAYYTIADMVTITVTDYFFPTDGATNNYFEYDMDVTGHVFEGMASFDGTNDLPLTVTTAVNLAGADADNSMYFELGYGFENANVWAGFATGSWYTTNGKFQGVNFGISTSKDVKITDDFSLPVSGSFIVNPNTENVFLVIGISI